MIEHWNGLSREGVEYPSLEVFEVCEHATKGCGLVMGLSRSGYCWTS